MLPDLRLLSYHPLDLPDAESESEIADSAPQFEGFGFCGKISVAKNKGSKKSHRENKKWKKVCHKLIEHGVTIPITLLKNPVAKKYFR